MGLVIVRGLVICVVCGAGGGVLRWACQRHVASWVGFTDFG